MSASDVLRKFMPKRPPTKEIDSSELRLLLITRIRDATKKYKIRNAVVIDTLVNMAAEVIEALPRLEDRKKVVENIIRDLPKVIHEGTEKNPTD